MKPSVVDRLETLDAVIRHHRSRLLAIHSPATVLDHACSLERQAAALLDAAQRIRASLQRDTHAQDEIYVALATALCEQKLLRYLSSQGITRDGHSLDSLVRSTVAAWLSEQSPAELAQQLSQEEST